MIYFYIGKFNQDSVAVPPYTQVYKLDDGTYWVTPEGYLNTGWIIKDELIAEVPDEMKDWPIEEIKLYINL